MSFNINQMHKAVHTIIRSFPQRLTYAATCGITSATMLHLLQRSSLASILPNLILKTLPSAFALSIVFERMTDYTIVTLLIGEEFATSNQRGKTEQRVSNQWHILIANITSLAIASLFLTGSCSALGVGCYILLKQGTDVCLRELQLLPPLTELTHQYIASNPWVQMPANYLANIIEVENDSY